MKHPKQTGILTEHKVITRLIELGYTVSLVIGDNARYDIILDINGELFKVQIKHARLKNGCIVFSAHSTQSNKKISRSISYLGQIDYFIVWCGENDQYYAISVDMLTNEYTISLRIEKAKNNQSTNVNYAGDYLLNDVLIKLSTSIGNFDVNGS